MSIVLKDGTVLPDLPEGMITEKFPYAMIVAYENATFTAYSSSTTIIHVPGVFLNSPYSVLAAPDAVVYYVTITPSKEDNWSNIKSASDMLSNGIPTDGGAAVFVVKWSNHDILEVVDVNYDTFELIYADEPYFPNSLAKPPFVLPDGTELPALPDGCFDGTPYGVVIHNSVSVGLFTASSPLIYFAEVPIGVENQPGIASLWDCIDGGWTPYENKLEIPAGAFGADLEGVSWSNHDIMNATRSDDGSYTIGTEIARKSDENYRVTGGYMTSIANEARRLGGKTGGMLPAVTEETLRGVTQGIPSAEGVEF